MMHETSRGHTLNNDVGFPLLYLATSQKYQTIDGLWLTLHCLQINWTLQMYFDWAGACVCLDMEESGSRTWCRDWSYTPAQRRTD